MIISVSCLSALVDSDCQNPPDADTRIAEDSGKMQSPHVACIDASHAQVAQTHTCRHLCVCVHLYACMCVRVYAGTLVCGCGHVQVHVIYLQT